MSIKDILKGINEKYIREGAKKIKFDDVKKVYEKADEILSKTKKSGILNRVYEDVKLLVSLAKDYRTGRYKEIPWWAISSIVFSLLYVFNPIDLVPDFIPILGQVDDAMIVSLCFYLVEKELHKYKDWKADQQA